MQIAVRIKIFYAVLERFIRFNLNIFWPKLNSITNRTFSVAGSFSDLKYKTLR